jgi:tetratricopeptide (TPR) repeat protein
LVGEELIARPEPAAQLAVDLLRQYLVTEERAHTPADAAQARSSDRVVADVLLDPAIVEQLLAILTPPQDRLAVRLAQTRRALIDGRLEQAQEHLAQAWRESAALPADALNITRIVRGQIADGASTPQTDTANDDGAVGDDAYLAETAGEAAFRQVRDLFLMELYQAKISERRRRWSDALRAYRACLLLLERVPADWGVTPCELLWNIGLIEQGSRDSDTLSVFLGLRDQMGDPLLNPAQDPRRVAAAYRNLRDLELLGHADPGDWLAPHLAYARGLCASLLRRPELALHHLRRVETFDNDSPALLQRALLEQAAVRDALDQSALAARLYGRIVAMELPLPVRAVAAVALIQSENLAGVGIPPVFGDPAAFGADESAIAADPLDRLNQLLPDDRLPEAWRDWLRLQAGFDNFAWDFPLATAQ